MCAFVELVKHGWDAVFPMPAPRSMMLVTFPTAMTHAAEEDHSHGAEEEKEEEDGATDRAEWEEHSVMTVHGIAISISTTIHHWRDGSRLSALCGFRDGGCHSGSLYNSLCNTGSVSHEAARGDQYDEEHSSNNAKN